MTRSSAGVGLDPLRWLGQVAGGGLDRVSFCVGAGVAAHPAGPGLYGTTTAVLAQLAGVRPNRVWPALRTLTGEGFLEPARRGGGRGRPTLYELAAPALFAAIPVPQEHGFRGETPAGEAWVSRKPVPQEHGFRGETPAGEAWVSSPPYPPSEGRREKGEGPPPPRLAPIEDTIAAPLFVAEAGELLAAFPPLMRGRRPDYRDRMVRQLSRWLESGWTAEQLLGYASYELPAEVRSPLGLLRSRVPASGPAVGLVPEPAAPARRSTGDQRMADAMALAAKFRAADAQAAQVWVGELAQ